MTGGLVKAIHADDDGLAPSAEIRDGGRSAALEAYTFLRKIANVRRNRVELTADKMTSFFAFPDTDIFGADERWLKAKGEKIYKF